MRFSNAPIVIASAPVVQGFSLFRPRSRSILSSPLLDLDEALDRMVHQEMGFYDSQRQSIVRQLNEPFFYDQLYNDMHTLMRRRACSNRKMVNSFPKYEVEEKAEMFKVTIEAPGFSPEDIEIHLQKGGRMLSVTGLHVEDKEGKEGDKNCLRSKFKRAFSLKNNVNSEELKASFEDGKLTITAPILQTTMTERRKIPIEMICSEVKEKEMKEKKVSTVSEKGDSEQLKQRPANKEEPLVDTETDRKEDK